MEDFTADAVNNSQFRKSLESFINENCFDVRDFTFPLSTFPFLNTAYSTTSWLDHVVTSKALKNI